ncbi:MAG: hypothetical protein CMK07_07975 [Ponticaulis sp.]|nr:hypothetical protein [Ponticaulis sp.]
MPKDDKIEVETINKPGYSERVDRVKYEAMRECFLAVLPSEPPGLTPKDAKQAMMDQGILPQDIWPGGDKAGWWIKCVQLDLEAKGVIKRAEKPPVRLWKL